MKIYKLSKKRQQDFVDLSQRAYGISQERARALSQLADNMLLVGKANETLNKIYAEWEGRAKRAYLDLGITKGVQKDADLASLNAEHNIAGIDAEQGIVIQRTEEDKETPFEALKLAYIKSLGESAAVSEDSTESESDDDPDSYVADGRKGLSVLPEAD